MSTNIAETSVTISGIKYIIDSGRVKAKWVFVILFSISFVCLVVQNSFEKAPFLYINHSWSVVNENLWLLSLMMTFVIFCRVYNPQSGLDLLRVVQVSKEQCIQRTGRAGREGPGICYRLFTEREFERFRENTMPEIQRLRGNWIKIKFLN